MRIPSSSEYFRYSVPKVRLRPAIQGRSCLSCRLQANALIDFGLVLINAYSEPIASHPTLKAAFCRSQYCRVADLHRITRLRTPLVCFFVGNRTSSTTPMT